MIRRTPILCIAALAAGCFSPAQTATESDDVTVDTSTPEARAQYDANVAFARSYAPRCAPSREGGPPRVLVTGFGRFKSITNNATGRAVAALVPGLEYPEGAPPPKGAVDPPGEQLAVATATVALPDGREVELCGMILPVSWDLAAILVAREIDAFAPSFVLMNGVARPRQPLWLELGSLNRAQASEDGSGTLAPVAGEGGAKAKLVESAPSEEDARPNLLAWQPVREAAMAEIARHAEDVEGEKRFGDVLTGALFAGFPRASNTYLCNNTTYTVGFLMDHPGSAVSLLRASTADERAPNEVLATIARDASTAARVFVHWPSELASAHHDAAAAVLRAMIEAQLASHVETARGHNDLADSSLEGGATF